MPLISYFKILNFVLFVWGIMLLSKAIQAGDEELHQMRVTLLGVSAFVVLGSVFAYFIPSIGYSMEVKKAAFWGMNITGSDVAARAGRKLFNGVMEHSQLLAIITPVCLTWTLCDMLLIQKKISRLHLVIVTVAPVLMFMSRSRTAMLTFVVSIFMIYFCCIPSVKLPPAIKQRLRKTMYGLLAVIIVVITFAQIRYQTLSKWIRKEDNIGADQRSVAEALTASRMGLVEYNLNDFKLNPVFGKGFQVMNWHAQAYKAHRISLLSAPIEKGVLPLMVLGETGLVGACVFIVFLLSFYRTCIRRKYNVLLCMFTIMLATNMSEASFFAPGGSAMLWIFAVIGGFSLDLSCKKYII